MPATDLNVRSIQWAMWANETVLLGANVLVLGGMIGIVGGLVPASAPFQFWLPIGIYGIVIGLLISTLEYPRGKKNKGNTVTRSYQDCFSKLVSHLPLVSNYYVRACAYFIMAIPGGLVVPTLLGTVFIIVGCGIYMGAACHGESWQEVKPWSAPIPQQQQPNFSQPPAQPPPRLPQNRM
uniref:Cytochrome b-245 light chain n=1 Tax=Phallusia mammillata TaxID=59560 RepID=A0A6F9DAV5_9ASCI|nr:cytochrome b-245 light chain [Phallusia mammillata]